MIEHFSEDESFSSKSCNRGFQSGTSNLIIEMKVSFKVDPAPLDYQATISQHNQFLMDGMFIILGTKTPIQKFIITFKTFFDKNEDRSHFFISGSRV